jgi:hypothetical protein
MVFTAPRKHSHLPKAREFSEKQDQAIMPLTRAADGSLGFVLSIQV